MKKDLRGAKYQLQQAVRRVVVTAVVVCTTYHCSDEQ